MVLRAEGRAGRTLTPHPSRPVGEGSAEACGRCGDTLLVLALLFKATPCCRHRKVFPGHWAAWGRAEKGIACDRAEDSACCWEHIGQMGRGEH